MKRFLNFLKSIDQNELITKKALQSIKDLDILEDWSLSLKVIRWRKKMTGLKK